MASRTQKKILQTRNILILVIVACGAKLAKIIKDGNAETAQIVGMAVVIVILCLVLALYMFIDRYTKVEQETYDELGSASAKLNPQDTPKGLKNICKDIFKPGHTNDKNK